MTDPTHNRGARRSAARRLNKATAHTERLEELDIPTWLLKPHQPATRLEVYTLLRKYDRQARWRDTPLWKKVIIAVWYIVTAPIRVPWQMLKRAWIRRAPDPLEQEQHEDERDSEVV